MNCLCTMRETCDWCNPVTRELRKEIQLLEIENAKLKKIADAARETVEGWKQQTGPATVAVCFRMPFIKLRRLTNEYFSEKVNAVQD